MLGSFIRLVDYMLVEALVDRTVGTVEELVAMLEAPRASTDKTHKVWYTSVQANAPGCIWCFVSACTFWPTKSPQRCVCDRRLTAVIWLSSFFCFAGSVPDDSVFCRGGHGLHA